MKCKTVLIPFRKKNDKTFIASTTRKFLASQITFHTFKNGNEQIIRCHNSHQNSWDLKKMDANLMIFAMEY